MKNGRLIHEGSQRRSKRLPGDVERGQRWFGERQGVLIAEPDQLRVLQVAQAIRRDTSPALRHRAVRAERALQSRWLFVEVDCVTAQAVAQHGGSEYVRELIAPRYTPKPLWGRWLVRPLEQQKRGMEAQQLGAMGFVPERTCFV